MPRQYSVSIDRVAVSAVQDLINITATSGMAFRVIRIELGQQTLTSVESKPIRLVRFPATVTAGSGGSAGTLVKLNSGDAAATVTAHINDTTAMTTSGTAAVLLARDWEFINGFWWAATAREDFVVGPSQGLALNLPVAPSGSMTVSGSMVIEELF